MDFLTYKDSAIVQSDYDFPSKMADFVGTYPISIKLTMSQMRDQALTKTYNFLLNIVVDDSVQEAEK